MYCAFILEQYVNVTSHPTVRVLVNLMFKTTRHNVLVLVGVYFDSVGEAGLDSVTGIIAFTVSFIYFKRMYFSLRTIIAIEKAFCFFNMQKR